MRCFKCQRFGHMAGSCNGGRRCAKCGGDHDIVSCSVPAPKCCNCGGSHMASSKECHQFIKAKQVQEIKESQKIAYAEALKKVGKNTNTPSSVKTSPNVPIEGSRLLPNSSNQGLVVVNKEALLAFMVDVLYGARDKQSRSDIIKFVSEAAVRFLGFKDYAPQDLHAFMRARQEPLCQPDPGDESEEDEEEGCDIEECDFEDNIDDV